MLSQNQFSLPRCKLKHQNQRNRLDELPDEIVSFIVSHFNSRDAARARLLSSTWRRRCASMSKLRFNAPDMFIQPLINPTYEKYINRFVSVVNQFLHYQEDHGSQLDDFGVYCVLFRDSTKLIDPWIRFAVSRGVKELHLSLGCEKYPCEDFYIFRSELLSIPNHHIDLRVVHLSACLLGPGVVIDHFRSVTDLKLQHTYISQEEFESIGSCCLNLERFGLVGSNVPSKLCISFRRLKFLSFITCYGIEEIAISSKSLTSFEYAGPVVKLCTSGAPNLENVYFRAEDASGIKYFFNHLAKDLPLVKTLSIFSEEINWIRCLPSEKAIFRNIKLLELSLHDILKLDFLTLFAHLSAFPRLEKLYLTLEYAWPVMSYQETEIGVSKRLKEVHITGFDYCTTFMNLALHFLVHGVGLEKMVLDLKYSTYLGGGRWGHKKKDCNVREYQEICDRFVGRFKANVIVMQ